MRRTACVFLALLACTACARKAGPPIMITRTELLTREVPVSTSTPTPPVSPATTTTPAQACEPRLSPAPNYPDRDDALRDAPSIYEQVQLLLAGRRMRMARERELADALRACARTGR